MCRPDESRKDMVEVKDELLVVFVMETKVKRELVHVECLL